jgi:quinol monooxygenase YgiN
MDTSVRVVAVLVAKEKREADLEALLRGMAASSRAEPGNLRYDLWRDAEQPGRFVLDEVYRDADALAGHRATPHFQNYLAHVGDLAATRTPMVLQPEDVA